jgi:erythromycin esterase-like protein
MLHKLVLLVLILLTTVASGMIAEMAYLLCTLITGELAVNLLAAVVVLGGISYGLTQSLTRRFVQKPQRWAAIVSTLSVVGLAAVIVLPTLAEQWFATPHHLSDSTIALLAKNTISLTTVQAESGFDDLQALRPILEGKRIVALGEATHGTSEFFRMKHRLLEFMVLEMGYEHFGMETSPEVAQVINDYIMGGTASPETVLYWPWATEEVMDMLNWMRDHNADPSTIRPLVFHGIDPRSGERDQVMAQNVARILEQNGPHSKMVLWAHNAHISNTEGWLGHYLKQEFGEQVYLLGFEFNQGAFTSRTMTVHTYNTGSAPPTYYAYALAQTGQPILYLDFRTMSRNPELQTWLAAAQSSHEFQELHAVYRLYPAWHTLYTSWLELYDAVVFIEESTPAASLQ